MAMLDFVGSETKESQKATFEINFLDVSHHVQYPMSTSIIFFSCLRCELTIC